MSRIGAGKHVETRGSTSEVVKSVEMILVLWQNDGISDRSGVNAGSLVTCFGQLSIGRPLHCQN